MQQACAVLPAGIEDLGLILVEAQACGTPVMARAEGGAIGTVDPAESGVLVASSELDGEAAALASFSRPSSPAARRQ